MTEMTHTNAISLDEANLVVACDLLDVTLDVLRRLSPGARAEISQHIAEIAPDYTDHATLIERLETALDSINH